MAKQRDSDDSRRRRRPREHGIDPVKVHEEYLKRHLEGGAPATPEAYARAIEQWHHLPGAVRMSATEVSTTQTAPSAPEGDTTAPGDDESEGGHPS